jgi:hypothetical protein
MAESTETQTAETEEEAKELAEVVDDLESKASEDGDLSAQDALDEFSGRLFGPLLVIPGLVTVSPIGMIPSVPTMMGVFTVLVAGQSLAGRKQPWLPGFLAERSVDEDKFHASVEKIRPFIEWIDKWTAQRMQFLVKGPMKSVVAGVCILLALTMPPLEVVPWACLAPGSAILALGLAITAQDGLLALIGLTVSLGAIGLLGWVVLGWVGLF